MSKSRHDVIVHVGNCPNPECMQDSGFGKFRWKTRRDAKRIARRDHPGEHMSAYACGDYWHIGHLPDAIIQGERLRFPNRPSQETTSR